MFCSFVSRENSHKIVKTQCLLNKTFKNRKMIEFSFSLCRFCYVFDALTLMLYTRLCVSSRVGSAECW